MFPIENLLKILLPNQKIRVFITTIILITVAVALGATVIINQIKKQGITDSQLEIEKNRIIQIDKKVAQLYQKAYNTDTNDTSTTNNAKALSELKFYKSQREEAVKNIDSINSQPDSQILIFTVILTGSTALIFFFFSSSFKSNQRNFDRGRYTDYYDEYRKKKYTKSYDFLDWIISDQVYQSDHLELERAKQLKDIFDSAETLGDKKIKFYSAVQKYLSLKQDNEDDKYTKIEGIFLSHQSRLKDECDRLNKQALINLLICFLIAFILVSYIAYTTIINIEPTNNYTMWNSFLIKYLPRMISILSVLTMFFYFTKLYKNNIIDVKYYQNELSNIEMKMIALRTAFIYSDKASIDEIAKELLKVERNVIITKDQTSFEIERLKIENDSNKNFLDKTWELLSAFNFKDKKQDSA